MFKLIDDPYLKNLKVLMENDKVKYCPFQPAFLMTNNFQPTMSWRECGQWCTHFNLIDMNIEETDKPIMNVEITCGGTSLIFEIEDEKPKLKLA